MEAIAVLALFAVFLVYCCARPHGGWDVFWAASVPGGISMLLHDLAGLPRLACGLALIPAALWMAHDADQQIADAESQPMGREAARE